MTSKADTYLEIHLLDMVLPKLCFIQSLSGGNLNSVLKGSNTEEGDETALVLKVFDENSKYRENMSSMFSAMRVAHAGGVGAPLIAR